MSQSAKLPTRMKSKKTLDTVYEGGNTRRKIKNTKKKTLLTAAPAPSPERRSPVHKRFVSSPDLEIVPAKKNKKKIAKESIGLLPSTDLVTHITTADILNMQGHLLEKQHVDKDNSARNIPNIIRKHRVTSKVAAPMNSLVDFKVTPNSQPTTKTVLKVATEDKYPILKNQELVKKFMAIPMTNNQKGRIRQVLREIFKGTSETLLPDVINNRIQAILKNSENLTDIDLRKIRILYNMLKKSTENQNYTMETETDPIIADKKATKKSKTNSKNADDDDLKNVSRKGPKRYVLFIGNLPLGVNKEQILDHFWDLRDSVKDVRLPKRDTGKKTAIAYIELMNEPSYELALSKHHTMLGNRRISIQYTTQKNGKITKAEAKSKSAKLQALIKTGQIIGSIAANKKRSARRAKARIARKLAESTA